MRKRDFVKELQETLERETGVRPNFAKTKDMLDSVISTMEHCLVNGKTFRFRGFGRFEFNKREGFERETHIRAGEKVEEGYTTKVDDRVVAHFSPSKKLNEKLTRRLKPILFADDEEE